MIALLILSISRRKVQEQNSKPSAAYREIQNTLDNLLKAEQSLEPGVYPASIDPYDFLGNLSDTHENLILFSRLLNGPYDVCTATSLRSNGALVVANNAQDSSYQEDYLARAQSFVINPFQDNYDELESLAKQHVSKTLKLPKIKKRILGLDISEQNFFASSENILDALNSPDSLSFNAYNLASELVQPVIDTRRFAELVMNNQLDLNISVAIQEGNTIFLTGRNQGMHAEMQIAEYLDPYNELLKAEIGISKVCCCPCGATLELLNNKEFGIPLIGTHGGTYPWIPPTLNDISFKDINDKLSSLKAGEFRKGRETTFEFEPINRPDLLNIHDFYELNAIIESKQDYLKSLRIQSDILQEEIETAKFIYKKCNTALKKYNRTQRDFDRDNRVIQRQENDRQELEDSLEKQQSLLAELAQIKENARESEELFLQEKDVDSFDQLKGRSQLLFKNLQSSNRAKVIGFETTKLNPLNKKINSLKERISQYDQQQSEIHDKSGVENKISELSAQREILQAELQSLESLYKDIKKQELGVEASIETLSKYGGSSQNKRLNSDDGLSTSERSWWNAGEIIRGLQSHTNSQVAGPAMNEFTLTRALQEVQQDNIHNRFIIPINQNAITGRVPDGTLGNNANHWTGLLITRNVDTGNYTVNFVDPMGLAMSNQLQGIVLNQLGDNVEITQPLENRAIQHANFVTMGDVTYIQGNDYDCGPLLVHAMEQLTQEEPELPEQRLSLRDSVQLGQSSRFKTREIRDIRHPELEEAKEQKNELIEVKNSKKSRQKGSMDRGSIVQAQGIGKQMRTKRKKTKNSKRDKNSGKNNKDRVRKGQQRF